MLPAADITATLDSTDGSSGFSIKDSAASEIGRIDSDGNLSVTGRIGIGTTGPAETLDVRGNIIAGSDASGGTLLLRAATAGTEGGQITLKAVSGNPELAIDSYNADLRFFRNDTDADYTPVRFIQYNSGGLFRVGVNVTESLTIPLESHALNTCTPPSYEAGTAGGFVTNAAAGNWCHISVVSGNTGCSCLDLGDADDVDIGQIRYNNSDNSMSFKTSGTDRVKINSGGNVSFASEVSVDAATTGTDSAGIKFWRGDGTNPMQYYAYMDLIPGTGLRIIGNGEIGWGYITDSSGWKAFCTRDIKNTITELTPENLESLYQEFSSTKVFSYIRNDVPGELEVGVIAEEAPDLITAADKKAVSPTKWLGWLTVINKHQHDLINRLQSDNNNLEERLSSLEQRLSAMEDSNSGG